MKEGAWRVGVGGGDKTYDIVVKALNCVVSLIECFTLPPLKRPDPGTDRTLSNGGRERCCILGGSES